MGRGLWGTNPPKAMADVVEAVIGAVHLHGGFAEGQRATAKLLKPVLGLLEEEDRNNSILQHPRQSLLEMGGVTVSLKTTEEHEYARENSDNALWLGKSWGKASLGGYRYIATVECLGKDILSIGDDTPSSAANRACAFVLAVLEGNPRLRHSFFAMIVEAARQSGANTMTTTSTEEIVSEDCGNSDGGKGNESPFFRSKTHNLGAF